MSPKAKDVIKSMAPETLEKTRQEVEEEIASDRPSQADVKQEKADLAIDMTLILVGKVKALFPLLWITLGISLLAVAGQILGQARSMDIQGKMIVVQETQLELAKSQRESTEAQKKNAEEVAEVKEEVKQTKEKVEEAVESAPKLEVDPKSGRTKVIVPVKRPKADKPKADYGGKKDLEEEQMSLPPPAPAPAQFDPQVELQ